MASSPDADRRDSTNGSRQGRCRVPTSRFKPPVGTFQNFAETRSDKVRGWMITPLPEVALKPAELR